MDWTPERRFYAVLCGQTPDRVPTLPKIWVGPASRLTGTELHRVIEDPRLAMRTVIEAALSVGADGARVFHFPARQTRQDEGVLVEIDGSGRRLGPIDVQGGLATRMEEAGWIPLEDPWRVAFLRCWNSPEPLLRSVDDARRMAVPDKSFYEQLGLGRWERELIAEFGHRIALLGDCDSATLAFCVLLRGMNNALLDLIEEPRLVHKVMEKGAAIAIEKGKFHIDCGLRMLRLNDSVANMSVISPRHWREFILPHMKSVCQELHASRLRRPARLLEPDSLRSRGTSCAVDPHFSWTSACRSRA